MFRIIDRRIRSASSKFERLETSAEMVLARAQKSAVRSLSLRYSKSRTERSKSENKEAETEADGNKVIGGSEKSRILSGLLSPRSWTIDTANTSKQRAEFKEEDKRMEERGQREMNYIEVQITDTLEGIAAAHDCTIGGLVKLNKLTSRMVFPGQKLLVPSVFSSEGDTKSKNGCATDEKHGKGEHKTIKDSVQKGPGQAVRTLSSAETSPIHHGRKGQRQSNAELGRMASELDNDDQECIQRFLKTRVKQITESDGTILGTLLVTPNCLMFDPDPDHPLVRENGSDLYGMVANMEDIVSVTVYKNISSLTGEKSNRAKDIFDPKNLMRGETRKESDADSQLRQNSENEKESGEQRKRSDSKLVPKSTCSKDGQFVGMEEGGHPLVYGTSAGGLLLGHLMDERKTAVLSTESIGSSPSSSEQQLPCINEENEIHRMKRSERTQEHPGRVAFDCKRRTVSDMNCHQRSTTFGSEDPEDDNCSTPLFHSDQFKSLKKTTQQSNSLDLQPLMETDKHRQSQTESDYYRTFHPETGTNRLGNEDQTNQQRRSPSPASPFSRYSPGMARKSFGKLGRTLSAKATSIRGTVQSGAQSVAHEVVSHTLSAADHIQSGIQNGAKMVASVPGSIMNVSTELLQEGQNGVKEVVDQLKALGEPGEQSDRSPLSIKREKSLATLETLCQRTQQAREQSVQLACDTGFVLGAEEAPVLFGEHGKSDESRPIGTPPEPPFYMVVRIDRRKKRKQKTVLVQKANLTEIGASTESNFLAAAELLQDEANAFGNKRKREFWFAIPQSRVDAIYYFLLQWSPQKYGKEKASTADETNESNQLEEGETTMSSSKLASAGTSATKHLGGFVVLEGDVDASLTGVTTQLNRSEGTNKAGRELICTLEERIWKENETTNAGQSPSVDSPKSTKTRHFCQQRPRLAAVDQPICYTLNEAIAKIPSEKFSTKISKLKQRITAPKQMVGQKKEADNQTNSGRVISTFSGAGHGRHNNECGEAICYSDQTTTKQKSNSLLQQHSFETDGSNEITTKQRLQRLRRKSTSSRKNMSLSNRYTASFSSSKGCAGFIVPPVFPKTCSLYDESFSGGVFVDHQEDRLLVEAVDRIRKRNFSCKEKEHDGCLQKQQTSADASQINGDFINENSDIDSGNSSITEGRQSPIYLPEFTRNFGRTEATQLKKAAENSDVASDANWKDTNQREGFLRKNCRLLHFVKKKGSESLDNEHIQNDDRENDKLPAERQWETDTTKRKSWRARLLRTLSVGSPSVGRVIKDKEKQRGEKPTSHFANLDREWEVVTVRELCRRLSLDDSLEPSEMPLPEGALHSQLLDEFMIRQIIDILPPRAEGYPWVQIYNSEKHGFSLTTLYRRMAEWDEEMSPVLLVVRDVNGHVFGAVSSGALKPCDHYYGTGDSSLLFRFTGEFPHTRELRTFTWTGENQFFVNATRESLSFGAGGGHFGLWLDADLNHGRSQKCATFDNEPLAGGQEEDFVVQFVEVFGFCMT